MDLGPSLPNHRDLQLIANYRSSATCPGHILRHDRVPGPRIDVVNALQEKDTWDAPERACNMALETVAPLSDDAIVNLPALAA